MCLLLLIRPRTLSPAKKYIYEASLGYFYTQDIIIITKKLIFFRRNEIQGLCTFRTKNRKKAAKNKTGFLAFDVITAVVAVVVIVGVVVFIGSNKKKISPPPTNKK